MTTLLKCLMTAAIVSSAEITQGQTNLDLSRQMESLRKDVDEAFHAYDKAKAPDESEKLWNTYFHLNDANLPKLAALAKQEPDSAASFETCRWVAENRRGSVPSNWTNVLEALRILAKYHAANTNLGPLCARVGYYMVWNWRETAISDFLHAVMKDNPDRAVRGNAGLALARVAKSKADSLAFFENAPTAFTQNDETNADFIALEKLGGSKAAAQEAAALFEEVIEKHGACANLRDAGGRKAKPTLAEEARPELFELLHLSIGKTAPDISGDDLDGNCFKLSDYRGKIVIVSFWASWCGPCMAMVPIERALVERMTGKPFVLIGVNGDPNRDDALRARKKEKMTWRSFWNGAEGSSGPIAMDWNVHGWPTVYILDGKGVVRLKLEGFGGKRTEKLLNDAVDQLLKEKS